MEGVLTGEVMKDWGPYPNRDSDTLVFSMGCVREAHGPVLPFDTDDRVAQAISLDITKRTGFKYAAHIPYVSDRIGEIAKDWCPAWTEPEYTTEKVLEFIKNYLSCNQRPVSRILILSGHGGNNFLKDEERRMSDSLDFPFLYIPPVVGNVYAEHEELGKIEIEHANSGEHSLGAYVGIIGNAEPKLQEINGIINKDPEEAMRRWKPIGALAWYVLRGGPRYEPLRNPEYGIVEQAEKFLKDGKIIADPEIGEELYRKNLENTMQEILKFTGD